MDERQIKNANKITEKAEIGAFVCVSLWVSVSVRVYLFEVKVNV